MTTYELKQDYLKKLCRVYDLLGAIKRIDVCSIVDAMASDFDELYRQHGELYKRSLYEKKND